MNWTSEFEPPPPRPTVDGAMGDDRVDEEEATGTNPADNNPLDIEDPLDIEGPLDIEDPLDTEGPLNIEDPLDTEGPLDPAVFDGLFDDLSLVDDGDTSDRGLEPVDYVELFDDRDGAQPPSTAVEEIPSEPLAETATAPDWQITVADLPRSAEDGKDGEHGEDRDPALVEAQDNEREAALLPGDQLLLDAPILLPDATEIASDSANSAPIFEPAPARGDTGAAEPRIESTILDDEQLPPAAPLAENPAGREYRPPRTERKSQLPAFAVATVVGAALGIGVALIAYRLASSDPEIGDASTPLIAEQTEPAADPDPASPTIAESSQASPVRDSAVLTSIGFIAGTSDLTETAKVALTNAAASLPDGSQLPLSITVRTFTESSAEANHALSQVQAQALKDFLDSLGLSFSSVVVRGLGAAPLSPALPVQNFVVVSPGLRDGPARTATSSFSPFGVGIDPETLELRPDSISHLAAVGDALAAAVDSRITLAGYSYDRPDRLANKIMAAAATEAARNYLVTNHQVDPLRILAINPGQLPYVVGTDIGGHVDVRIGPSASVGAAIGALDREAMNFSPGSARLSDVSETEFDRLAQILMETGASVIITVHTATQSSAAANAELSMAQADVILSYLVAAGVSAERLRVIGAGDVQGISHDGLTSSVIITTIG